MSARDDYPCLWETHRVYGDGFQNDETPRALDEIDGLRTMLAEAEDDARHWRDTAAFLRQVCSDYHADLEALRASATDIPL